MWRALRDCSGLLFGSLSVLSIFYVLIVASGGGSEDLLVNPSFEEWSNGCPASWGCEVDPGAGLERWGDAMEGNWSIRLMNVRSFDAHIFQNFSVPRGSGDGLILSLWCRIDYSDDIASDGIHSPTGIEIGFEGGDVDGDGFDEYLYIYFFVDDDIRPEDFTVLARIYNTTEGVDHHKIAILRQMSGRGRWEFFEFNVSSIFLETLGGCPAGEYEFMVWAVRWGEPRDDCGLTGFVDGIRLQAVDDTVFHVPYTSSGAGYFGSVAFLGALKVARFRR